jgi:hypothetical protein
MSTVTRPSPESVQISRPAMVSIATSRRPVSRISMAATQRVPLPQAWASVPSGLWIAM